MVSGARLLDRAPALARLSAAQASVCSREQLRAVGVGPAAVSRQLAQRRWQAVGPLVVVLHNGPLPVRARRWAAALTVAPSGAVCAWTALSEWGLSGWERPGVHVVVHRGATPPRIPDVVVHESRRHHEEDVVELRGMRVHTVERAAVDAAAWSGNARTASALLAAVVQQRLTAPERLSQTLERVGRVRYLRVTRAALADVAGGAQALSEIDVARLCRRAGLPEPARQSVRVDARGRRRYLDVEWRLPSGRRVLLEIDGVGHLEVTRWYDDLLRAAEVVRSGEHLIRLPSMAARLEPERVAAILRRHLLA